MVAEAQRIHALLSGSSGQLRAACGALDRSEADLPVAEFDAIVRFGSGEQAAAEFCADCQRVIYAVGDVGRRAS